MVKFRDPARNPPPSIYSQPSEYANPTFTEGVGTANANYVPTPDVYLAYQSPQAIPPATPQIFQTESPSYAGVVSANNQIQTQTVCYGNGDCPPGYVCQNGVCIPMGGQIGSGQCQSNGDCPSGYVCINGTCMETSGQAALNTVAPSQVGTSSNSWIFLGILLIAIAAVFFVLFRNK